MLSSFLMKNITHDSSKKSEGIIMDENKYIQERLENQINWYDSKSVSNQKWFKLLRIIEAI